MQKASPFGSNNFDKLANAGLAITEDQTEATKEKMQRRIADLTELEAKVSRVIAYLSDVYEFPKQKRISRLTQVIDQVRSLIAEKKLPAGSKRYIVACLNELVSLTEGVRVANDTLEPEDFVLTTCIESKASIGSQIVATTQRLDMVLSESTSITDTDAFWNKSGAVIKALESGSSDLESIKTQNVVVCRSSVIPADVKISPDRFTAVGFDIANIGGYAVFKNQIVLGISPRSVLGLNGGSMKDSKAISLVRDEAERMRRQIQKKLNLKLQFVSGAYTFGTGIWFWLMTDADINRLGRAGGGHVKIQRWGFAF